MMPKFGSLELVFAEMGKTSGREQVWVGEDSGARFQIELKMPIGHTDGDVSKAERWLEPMAQHLGLQVLNLGSSTVKNEYTVSTCLRPHRQTNIYIIM